MRNCFEKIVSENQVSLHSQTFVNISKKLTNQCWGYKRSMNALTERMRLDQVRRENPNPFKN